MANKNSNQNKNNKSNNDAVLLRIIRLLLIIAVIEIAIGNYYMKTLDKFVQYPDNNRIPLRIGSSDQKQQIATNDNSSVLPEEGNSEQKNNQQEDVAKTINNANSFLRQQQQQQEKHKHEKQEEPGKNRISHPLTADANDKNSSPLKIKQILRKAGVQVTQNIMSKLPPYAEVVNMYGDSPVIEGLETCEAFRTSVDNIDRLVGPSGMFNSGTNLLAELLRNNCFIPERKKSVDTGMRWQVPWGKHTPASYRFKHKTDMDRTIVQENVLPVVIIKDPYSWMGSMCRHTYETFWIHTKDHCPNLIPNDVDMTLFPQTAADDPIPVEVAYHPLVGIKQYSSLVELWSDWYGAYYTASFPRLMIRFEDLLFHAESVITQVCSCAGGETRSSNGGDAFRYVSESAKGTEGLHKGSSGLGAAIIRYSNAQKRVDGFTNADLDYAARELDQDMISKFRYAKPITTAAA